jgi:hypothetical protein
MSKSSIGCRKRSRLLFWIGRPLVTRDCQSGGIRSPGRQNEADNLRSEGGVPGAWLTQVFERYAIAMPPPLHWDGRVILA